MAALNIYLMDAAQRRQSILFMASLGSSNKKIAELLRVNIKTVEKWRSRENTTEKPRVCKPRVLTEEMKVIITHLCRDNWNASTRLVAKTISLSGDDLVDKSTVSKSSVSRYVRSTDWGKIAYKRQTATMLSSKNIHDRQRFCGNIHSLGYCGRDQQATMLLEHILFTDESIIELYPSPNAQNTRIRTSNRQLLIPESVPKNGTKIMVAGGMCAGGLTELHIVEQGKTVDGCYYRTKILPIYLDACARTIEDVRIDHGILFSDKEKVVFMQDGAPAHTANATLTLINQTFKGFWSKGIWPGNSPDLNPIEHIWPVLKNSVFVEPRPRNRDDLVKRVQDAWKGLSKAFLQRLIFSFPRRIEACQANLGGRTDY